MRLVKKLKKGAIVRKHLELVKQVKNMNCPKPLLHFWRVNTMKDESQKKNFLLWIIPVSIVLGIILTAASAIAGEK